MNNTKGILQFEAKESIDMTGYRGIGKVRFNIADCMRKYKVKRYAIQESDINRGLEWGWGTVLSRDVNKLCIIKDGLFYMENQEQLKKRLS